MLETGGDEGFNATSFEAVLIRSLCVNKIVGNVVVDTSNNILF